jgi:hypothetical protein
LTHGPILSAQQVPRLFDDAIRRCSDELGAAAFQSLGPFAFLTKNQQGNAERGRFLLDAAGVAQNDVSRAHALDKLAVPARFRKGDVAMSIQLLPHCRSDVRIRVQDEFDGGVIRQLAHCGRD